MGNRRKNKLDMTVTEQLQSIVDTICDKYCKYPDEYMGKIKDVDEAQEAMQHEVCEHCPFMEL